MFYTLQGYCLVEFETYREALLAKEAMDNSKILGQTISVDWAFVKNPRKYEWTERVPNLSSNPDKNTPMITV